MYNAKSLKAEEFISDEEIRETLAYADANKDNVALIDERLSYLTGTDILCDGGCIAGGASAFAR